MPRPMEFADAEERYQTDEAIAQAFAPRSAPEGNLPAVVGGMAGGTPDLPAIVTAQRVEKERDHERIFQKIRALAAAAGDDWYYSYPAKDRATGKTTQVEGPSIKCAMNVVRLYGNCAIDTRVVDAGDSWIIYAKFVDFEEGYTLVRPYQQRKGQQAMGSAGRANDMVFSIGVSKAQRNVITNALETYTNFAFEEAKNSVVEKVGKKIELYREKVKARLTELKVDHIRVERLMGRTIDAMLAGDIAKIIAEIQAVTDGMADPNDIWPGDAPARPDRATYGASSAPPRPTQTVNPAAPRTHTPRTAPAAQERTRQATQATPPAGDTLAAGDAEFSSWQTPADGSATDVDEEGDQGDGDEQQDDGGFERRPMPAPVVTPRKLSGGHYDWVTFVKELLEVAGGAQTEADLVDLSIANKIGIDRLQIDDPVGYERFIEKMEELKGNRPS